MCLGKEKRCSARDSMRIGFCRAEDSYSFKKIQICYDLITIIKKLYFSEGTIVRTHRNREMPNYWVFIDI